MISKNKNIKGLYRLIVEFEEELQIELLSRPCRTKINTIRNLYGDIFEKEIYDNEKHNCDHCEIIIKKGELYYMLFAAYRDDDIIYEACSNECRRRIYRKVRDHGVLSYWGAIKKELM